MHPSPYFAPHRHSTDWPQRAADDDARRAAEERAAMQMEALSTLYGAWHDGGALADRLEYLSILDPEALSGEGPRPLRRVVGWIGALLTHRARRRHASGSSFDSDGAPPERTRHDTRSVYP